jgi:Tol biopolymer transport system component
MVRLHLLNGSAGILTDHLPHRALCGLLLVCFALGPAPPRAHAEPPSVTRLTDDGRSYTRVGLGWSPDNRHILFLKEFEEGHQLWLMKADGSDAKPISKLGWQGNYGWSPDSTKIMYSYAEKRDNNLEGSLHLYDVHSGQSRQLAAGYRWVQLEDYTGYATAEWTPDSNQFALLIKRTPEEDSRTDSYLFDITTGARLALTPNHYYTGGFYAGSWSPDGSRIAMVSQSSPTSYPRIWICNRDGSDLHPITPDDWAIAGDPRWSPDGKWIAFPTTHGRLEDEKQAELCDVWLIRPDGTDAHSLTQGSSPSIGKRRSFLWPEWATDGRHLVCIGVRFDDSGRSYTGIHLIDAARGGATPIVENDPESDEKVGGFNPTISVHPHGQRVSFSAYQETILGRKTDSPVSQDRRDALYCYDIPTRTLHEVMRVRPEEDGTGLWYGGFYWKPFLSPDGSRLLFTKARVVSFTDLDYEPDLYLAELADTLGVAPPPTPLPAQAVTPGAATVILPHNRRASEIADSLPDTYRGIYRLDPGLNALVVSAPDAETLQAFRQDVALLDQDIPQVMVDVLVTELSRDASRQLGLDWEYVRGSLRAVLPLVNGEQAGQAIYRGVGTFDKSFFATLAALEEHGQADVRANPRVLARCGSQATINIRRTDNFFYDAGTDYQGHPVRARSDISADTILRITPHLLASGRIALQVDATVDSFIFGGRDELPDTTRRQATTDVVCGEGESIVIGGLTQEEQTTKRQKTPLLGDIPLLGQLFRHTTRATKESTLVIFITPHLISGGETAP